MSRSSLIVCLLLCLGALLFSAIIYPSLPDVIPTHWNIRGEVDGHGSKTWGAFLLPVTMFGLLGLFQVLPWLSPKQFEIETFRKTYDFIIMLAMGLFTFMHVLFLLPALEIAVKIDRALMIGLFLFFMLLGNVLGKVQRNFFVGIRTPWTLASDRVWADTHRLASWVFFGMGLLGIVFSVVGLHLGFSIALLMIGVLSTVIYSLVRYKQLERRGEV